MWMCKEMCGTVAAQEAGESVSGQSGAEAREPPPTGMGTASSGAACSIWKKEMDCLLFFTSP